ncbi:MAG: ribonuclease HI [Holosporaceae bacterium]|jgi:ribonuclease HI|nr:ribonuclease HI [Holosporaceae bacterium]
MKKVVIYTDGACKGNPGPGGWGAIILDGLHERELCGSDESTTNNRMELMAAIMALESLQGDCSIAIYTDSKYLVGGMTKWMNGWIKNSWKNSEGKAVKNKELWVRLLALSRKRNISWHWVEGHAGQKYNERVDKLAKSQCH